MREARENETEKERKRESGLGDPWMHGSWPLSSLESQDLL